MNVSLVLHGALWHTTVAPVFVCPYARYAPLYHVKFSLTVINHAPLYHVKFSFTVISRYFI